ncbi:unnamed protein product [Arctia plantaginis]|uniref:Zinc finger protein n=1 Tax=Arctia plantaginis TaxID=874455 RepID=A0A8S1AH02_ARCPL|nr:unnamed protein product [Arctia plantaginis]
MDSQVCVICHNKKPVNSTDNRLVTESCGHVKCMDCLLMEKSGCLACKQPKYDAGLQEEQREDRQPVAINNILQGQEKSYDDKDTQCETYELFTKKKKPETSHIKIETDANGKCYECTVCNKKFHARSQVAYHAYCNGQRKPYQCPDCNKSFATQSHYKYHMRVHRNERTYSCEVCGDSFFQMSKLQRHKLKHTKEKKFVCNQCEKAFNNLTSLRKHGLTHTEERPYPCATCGRCFRDSSNYRKHVAKHEKKCACGGWSGWGSCGRGACAGRGARTAGGARRPHQCPRCPQAFHSSKDMRRHAAVHTDSKPFRCKVCNRRFRRKDNLERHIRNTHPDYSPSSAVECDEAALIEIANGNTVLKQNYENDEKIKLEKGNPLPPLPPDVIQKHMYENGNKNEAEKCDKNNIETSDKMNSERSEETGIDTSYILVANNARQSVIVNKKAVVETKPSSPKDVCEYVHKIRKASTVRLPPIDMSKMFELEEQTHLNNLEFGTPAKEKKTVYEKILYGDKDKRENEETNADAGAEIHWRRKIKQSVSIDLK